MRKMYIRAILILMIVSGSLRAQNSFWSPRMKALAEARSSRGWIYLQKDKQLPKEEFIITYGDLLGLTPLVTIQEERTSTDEAGIVHTHYNQTIGGIPVIGARISFHEQDNKVRLVSGQIAQPVLSGNARMNEPMLRKALLLLLGNKQTERIGAGEDVYLAERNQDRSLSARRCMRFLVHEDAIRHSWYYLDACTGQLVDKRDEYAACNVGTAVTANYGSKSISTAVSGGWNILLNDCYQENLRVYNQNNDTLPTFFDYVDLDNAWPSASSPGTQTLWCLSNASSFYRIVNSRISMSGSARTTVAMANCKFKDGNNWTGWGAFYSLDTLYFGSNGASLTDDLGVMDVVAHEYTHGVTHYASFLPYTKEMGAINESFSDIFGEIVENWVFSTNNWQVATDCGTTLRSFINPNVYAQPSYYKGAYWHNTNGTTAQDSADNFGVHTNSGVQNYMFYLLVNGGSGINTFGRTVSIQPVGMLTARAIAYNALENYVGPFTDYPDARECWLAASDVMYGWCSFENMQVAKAWDAVGVIDNNLGVLNVCGNYPYTTSGGSTINLAVAQSFLHVADSGCAATVSGTIPVEFKATQYIRIFPGFHATAGSQLFAHLDSCSLALWKTNGHMNEEDVPEMQQEATRIGNNGFSATVSPNPFSDQLTVQLTLGENDGRGTFVFTDGTGRLLFTQTVAQEGGTSISYSPAVSDLPSGIYFISYKTDEGVRWQNKLVKM